MVVVFVWVCLQAKMERWDKVDLEWIPHNTWVHLSSTPVIDREKNSPTISPLFYIYSPPALQPNLQQII